MRIPSTSRQRASSRLTRIPDIDLEKVVGGGAGPGAPQIIFPPYPPFPQRSIPAPMPAPRSPWSFEIGSRAGTNQTPQHKISLNFDNGKFFAGGTVYTPAVPTIPPVPSINGSMVGGSQTIEWGAGAKIQW